mgnify:FL=1
MAKTTTHADYTATALTLTTAAQPNITSLGTLTALTGGTGDINWDSGTLFVDSSANTIGIGTTSPLEKLDVRDYTGIAVNSNYCHVGSTVSGAMGIFGHNIKSDSTANTIKSANTGYHSSMIKMYYDEGITFHATSSTATAGDTFYNISGTTNELMRITNDGKVGIGNTSPTRDLTVGNTAASSAINIKSSASNGYSILALGDSGDDNYAQIFLDNSTNKVQIQNGGGGALGNRGITLDSNENVGIGDSSPANFSGYVVASLADSTGAILDFKTTGSEGVFARIQGAVNNGLFITNEQNYPIALNTNATERMRILGDGKVGIGTSSPSQKFEVFPDDDHAAIIGRARIGNVGYGDYAGFAHLDAGDEYAVLQQNNGHTYINAASGEDISFRISNADKMQLLSNGRVVIGTGSSSNAGLLVSNADIRCTGSAIANDGNSVSMSQESAGSFINARGAHTSARGTLGLHVSASNGGLGITALTCNNDGSVSKYSGSFKIDHPLESKKDTHHLVHSFVEGPQADNIYRGVVALENGSATINLDTVSGMTEGTFAALNTNTSCFTSNETDWDSVKGSISGNTLTISCQNTSSTATVSWLVIGERHDQHMMEANWTDDNGKVIVEPLKESEFSFLKESE